MARPGAGIRRRGNVPARRSILLAGLLTGLLLHTACVALTVQASASVELARPSADKSHTVLETVRPVLEHLNDVYVPELQSLVKSLRETPNATFAADALGELGQYYLMDAAPRNRNYSLGLAFLNKSAELGNSSAQHMMAFTYATGLFNVEKSEVKSILHDYFAALGGNVGAMMTMGYRHLQGEGVVRRCETALLYYEMAANAAIHEREMLGVPPLPMKDRLSEARDAARSTVIEDSDLVEFYEYSADNRDPKALFALGQIYYYGVRGVKQDLKKALEFLRSAAEYENTDAHGLLGTMFARGYGTVRNYELALQHFKKAAMQGSSVGLNGLGFLYANGYGVTADINKAIGYFKKAKDQGNVEAFYNLGTVFLGSYGAEHTDYVSASQLFSVALHHGHVLAAYKYAQMQMHGLGTMKSCPNAVTHFKKVAERGPWVAKFREYYQALMKGDEMKALIGYSLLAEEGYEAAQDNAAWMFDNQKGYTEEDYGLRAVELYKQAALQNNVEANIRIGDHYYYGKSNVGVQYEKAALYYQAAAKQSHSQALFNLGYMHQFGVGLPQDFHLAKRYFDMATEASPQAEMPVKLALWGLQAHRWWLENDLSTWSHLFASWLGVGEEETMEGSGSGSGSELSDEERRSRWGISRKRQGASGEDSEDESGIEAVDSDGKSSGEDVSTEDVDDETDDALSSLKSLMLAILDSESITIFVLTVILGFLLYYRSLQ